MAGTSILFVRQYFLHVFLRAMVGPRPGRDCTPVRSETRVAEIRRCLNVLAESGGSPRSRPEGKRELSASQTRGLRVLVEHMSGGTVGTGSSNEATWPTTARCSGALTCRCVESGKMVEHGTATPRRPLGRLWLAEPAPWSSPLLRVSLVWIVGCVFPGNFARQWDAALPTRILHRKFHSGTVLCSDVFSTALRYIGLKEPRPLCGGSNVNPEFAPSH